MVRSSAGACPQGDHQMAARGHCDSQLGQSPHRLRTRATTALLGIFGPHPATGVLATPFVMPADMVRFIAGAVHRQRVSVQMQQPLLRRPLHQQVQYPVHAPPTQQIPGRPAQRVVVGNPSQLDLSAPVGAIAQQRLGSAVASLQLLLHDQAGKQLWQGEVFTGKLAGVPGQAILCHRVRQPHHLPWRFAAQHP